MRPRQVHGFKTTNGKLTRQEAERRWRRATGRGLVIEARKANTDGSQHPQRRTECNKRQRHFSEHSRDVEVLQQSHQTEVLGGPRPVVKVLVKLRIHCGNARNENQRNQTHCRHALQQFANSARRQASVDGAGQIALGRFLHGRGESLPRLV